MKKSLSLIALGGGCILAAMLLWVISDMTFLSNQMTRPGNFSLAGMKSLLVYMFFRKGWL